MTNNALVDQELLKKRLQSHLVGRVITRLSGRDGADVVGNPSRSLFAGVLRPRSSVAIHPSGSADQHSLRSLGLDFRARPTRGADFMTLLVKVKWSCYYAVFPSWEMIEAHNALLRGNKGHVDASGLPMPVAFRRKVFTPESVEIRLDSGFSANHTISFDTFMSSHISEINNDDDRWRHLDDPSKNSRLLKSTSPVVDSDSYHQALSEIKPLRSLTSLPAWSVSLRCIESRDIADSTIHRIMLLLCNDTESRSDFVKDYHLEERALIDASVDVIISNGDVVPFNFLLAESDYRTAPVMIAKGINCSVEESLELRGLRTETLPIYKQPLYRTRDESGVPFAILDVDRPTEVLNRIAKSMDAFDDEWSHFLAKDGKDRLSTDELSRCALDRSSFNTEIDAFRLGLECLERSPLLNRAFRLMNRTFARLGQRSRRKIEAWRLFQVCFIVTQLPSLIVRELNGEADDAFSKACRRSFEEATVLWFPTGGGKTEAYLGLIATSLLFDRLRGKSRGVSTWMRFPLRMLSLQQMERLAQVIADLNKLRSEEPDILPGDPFCIGYYVGSGVTPNAMTEQDMTQLEGSPFLRSKLLLLRHCPYCGTDVEIKIDREHWRVLHQCKSSTCFSNTSDSLGDSIGGLPLLVVDQEIYRRLPSVLVGTVDKLAIAGFNAGFAQLLLGSNQKCPRHGYTRYDNCLESYSAKCNNTRMSSLSHLAPIKDPGPSLLLQDELHLLKSELGVFNGHYEGFLQFVGTKTYMPPKVLAATATIEAYEHQTFHLYLRHARRFPQPSWMKGESFYATSRPEQVRRIYVGVMCHTPAVDDAAARLTYLYQHEVRLLKADITRTKSLVGAAQASDDEIHAVLRLYDLSVAYVNRKATGSTLLDKIEHLGSTLARDGLPMIETDLLTGDRSPGDIGSVLERIDLERNDTSAPRLDVVAATSLISHGVDIDRINMMAICGMPSHVAEYVQSSSRAARSHPGVVFTCFLSKDIRERSQYEMFFPIHENIDALIEPVAVNRFASFAPMKTVPGLLSALLINYYGPVLYKNGLSRSLMHIPTARAALGISSAGSSGTTACITVRQIQEALEAIIGVDSVRPEIAEIERSNVRAKIASILDTLIGQISRTTEQRLSEELKPITSFRDVDEGLEFASLESADLVLRLNGR